MVRQLQAGTDMTGLSILNRGKLARKQINNIGSPIYLRCIGKSGDTGTNLPDLKEKMLNEIFTREQSDKAEEKKKATNKKQRILSAAAAAASASAAPAAAAAAAAAAVDDDQDDEEDAESNADPDDADDEDDGAEAIPPASSDPMPAPAPGPAAAAAVASSTPPLVRDPAYAETIRWWQLFLLKGPPAAKFNPTLEVDPLLDVIAPILPVISGAYIGPPPASAPSSTRTSIDQPGIVLHPMTSHRTVVCDYSVASKPIAAGERGCCAQGGSRHWEIGAAAAAGWSKHDEQAIGCDGRLEP